MGCGSGVLLSILSEAFPQSRFEGIEPFSGGFSKFKETNAVVKGGKNRTLWIRGLPVGEKVRFDLLRERF